MSNLWEKEFIWAYGCRGLDSAMAGTVWQLAAALRLQQRAESLRVEL